MVDVSGRPRSRSESVPPVGPACPPAAALEQSQGGFKIDKNLSRSWESPLWEAAVPGWPGNCNLGTQTTPKPFPWLASPYTGREVTTDLVAQYIQASLVSLRPLILL